MPIRQLPTLLVNQIAAGEVIERPASVVKELLENSLDAGATRLDIAVEEGGTQLIRIADDGHGIPPEELPLAIAPHATSKLASAADLEAIATFGFRGEALASIASVSRLRLSAVHTSGGEGGEIQVEGDAVSDVKPYAGAPGTVIEVRDLFFNTPARRRFLRSPPTEFGHIHETVIRAAMVHPRVGFRLSHNGRVVRDLPPGRDRRTRCVELLGKEIEEGLLEFEHAPASDDGASVWGLAGQPSLARGNGKSQYLCVNGRPVRDRNLQHAIKEAYRGLMPHDRFPLVVVFLTIDPRQVDVNVHPTKSEVRFRNPSRVHGLVQSAIRQRLLGEDLTPKAQMSDGGFRMPDVKDGTASEARHFVDYFKRMDPTQKSLVFEDIKREVAVSEPSLLDPPQAIPHPPSPIRHTPILQVARSYLVTEDDAGGILIVDQHALHERVMFEQLRRRVLEESQSLESQRLLMPVVVDCDPRKQELLDSLRPLLERIGVEAEPIGPDAVAVQAFPSFLFDRKVDPAEFITELIDRAEQDGTDLTDTSLEAALHVVLDMMACKAAVKAGDQMSELELAELLKMRLEIERSSNCPHGRPTTLRLSLKDLAKQFGRT